MRGCCFVTVFCHLLRLRWTYVLLLISARALYICHLLKSVAFCSLVAGNAAIAIIVSACLVYHSVCCRLVNELKGQTSTESVLSEKRISMAPNSDHFLGFIWLAMMEATWRCTLVLMSKIFYHVLESPNFMETVAKSKLENPFPSRGRDCFRDLKPIAGKDFGGKISIFRNAKRTEWISKHSWWEDHVWHGQVLKPGMNNRRLVSTF